MAHERKRGGGAGRRCLPVVLIGVALAVAPTGTRTRATPPGASGLARKPSGNAGRAPTLPNLRLAGDGFLGRSDRLMLDRLHQGQIDRIEKGAGGRSLGFKLYFRSGEKAYFKPAQTFSGAIWYAEVAAYHLDRMLGMRRVPPVASYRLAWKRLQPAAGSDPRREEVQPNPDGSVDGALVYWLPESLQPAVTPPGWENWVRVAPLPRWAVSPYQRPAAYAAALRRRRTLQAQGKAAETYYEEAPAEPVEDLAPALSDMLVLDFLTLNIDRWGGNNTNVLTYGERVPQLIFLDNAAGFSEGPHRRGLMDDRLALQQCFRRSTVAALRAFELARLRARLRGEAVAPILSDRLLEGIDVRRRALLAHVDGLIEAHGEDAVLAWP